MQRTVSNRMEIELAGPSEMVFSMAVASESDLASETISFLLDGVE